MFDVLYSAVYGEDGYPFHHLADKIEGVVMPNEITEQNSALVIWGGADIDPRFYNHPKSRHTGSGGTRDYLEWELLNKAVNMGIPVIGVCRGAQMLCAKAGGFLIQDVRNHAGAGHMVSTKDDKRFKVNSLHHQMMFAPKEVDHEVLAWCENPLSVKYDDDNGSRKEFFHYIYKQDEQFVPPEGFKEPECIYFPKIKGFAVQWHPEMMYDDAVATAWIYEQLVNLKWIKELPKIKPQ
jgi:hypothetical protein